MHDGVRGRPGRPCSVKRANSRGGGELSAWFLTADERGNPATTSTDGTPSRGRKATSVARLSMAAVLRPVARRAGRARTRRLGLLHRSGGPTPTSCWLDPAPERSPVLCGVARRGVRCAACCGARTRTRHTSASREPALCRRHQRGRRRGPPRRAGATRREPPPEAVRHPPPRRRRTTTSPSSAASTCATAATTTRAPRRSAGDRPRPPLRSDARRGTTCSSRCAARRSATSSTRSANAGRIRCPLAPSPGVAALRPHAAGQRRVPGALPPQPPDPPPVGTHAVQVLRTYPAEAPGYPFAPRRRTQHRAGLPSRRSRGAEPHLHRGPVPLVRTPPRRSPSALAPNPAARVVAVVPALPRREDASCRAAAPASGSCERSIGSAAGGDRVAVYDLENDRRTPIYVHAKVCIVDDVWLMIGSDNLNRRSWTHDSEMSCAVIDDPAGRARAPRPGGLGDGRACSRGTPGSTYGASTSSATTSPLIPRTASG